MSNACSSFPVNMEGWSKLHIATLVVCYRNTLRFSTRCAELANCSGTRLSRCVVGGSHAHRIEVRCISCIPIYIASDNLRSSCSPFTYDRRHHLGARLGDFYTLDSFYHRASNEVKASLMYTGKISDLTCCSFNVTLCKTICARPFCARFDEGSVGGDPAEPGQRPQGDLCG